MRVVVHRGLDEVGGNIVEVSAGGTRILLDAGEELEGFDNPVDFPALLGERRFDAVFVSHYHGDHAGLLCGELDLPPVYMGRTAFSIFEMSQRRCGKTPAFDPACWLEDGVPVTVGAITVTPVLADHSAIDAYSLVVEAEGKVLLYTGDFRSSGRKSFDRYLGSLPEGLDALVTEGTALGREETAGRVLTELKLEAELEDAFERSPKQAFVLTSSTNMDRMVSVYKAAKRSGRVLLQDTYQGELCSLCARHKIPNPATFGDVRAYTLGSLGDEQHVRAKELFGRRFVGKEQIAGMRFAMCVRASAAALGFLRKLDALSPLSGSVMVYSMWEGYRDRPGMASFLEGVGELGIELVSIHASGHADASALLRLLGRTRPAKISPIHTESAGWFDRNCGGKAQVCNCRETEV